MSNLTVAFNTDDILVSSITLTIAVPSIVVAIVTQFLTFRNGKMNNALLMLTTSLTICDVGNLFIFVFWMVPVRDFVVCKINSHWCTSKSRHTTELSLKYALPGQVSTLFWFASVWFLLGIAINRLVAVTKPLSYKTIFTTKSSVFFMLFFWAASLGQSAVYFIPDCFNYYDPDWYSWSYGYMVCLQMRWPDFFAGNISVIVIFVINMITLKALRSGSKTFATTSRVNKSNDSVTRRNRENRFFVQAVANTAFLIVCNINYSLTVNYMTSKWGFYNSTVLPWIVSHAANGYLTIALQGEIRERWICLLTMQWSKALKRGTTVTNVKSIVTTKGHKTERNADGKA